jgi:NAD(P)-dependent dehydrogenase (short-subunit alcohol dehydrogenase family)
MTEQAALVTGGARRIGRAIVEDLAANGFAVAVHCNNSRTEADELVAGIVGAGGMAATVEADLTDMEAVDGLIESATKAVGPVTLLVNNASMFDADSVLDFDWKTWDMHFALHVKTPALLSRRFAEALPQDAEGLIVNIVDERVWRPRPRHFSYTLSKSALWTMTQTLAQALAPRIRVNAIGPGPTLPNTRQTDAEFQRQLDSLILRRGPHLGEFGATIRYLMGARSVTGQMIALDGGRHLAWQTSDVTGMTE